MTLEKFLDVLEQTADREWFVTPEGWLRCFVDRGKTAGNEQQWDWVVSAVARLTGRDYSLFQWKKNGDYLNLKREDMEALKAADQHHPDFAELRKEIEKRLGLALVQEQEERLSEQDAKVAAAMEDLKAPWQKEQGKEEQQWTEFLQKGEVKV